MREDDRLAPATILALYRQGEWRQALQLAQQALQRTPQQDQLLNIAGAAAWSLGLIEEAERYWRLALMACPECVDRLYNLGSLLLAANRLEEAEPLIRDALMHDPTLVAGWCSLARLKQQQQHFVAAQEAVEAALTIQPADAEARLLRAELLQEIGVQLDQAEWICRELILERPNWVPPYRLLGRLLIHHRRFEEADSVLRQALVMQPDDSTTRNQLAALQKQRLPALAPPLPQLADDSTPQLVHALALQRRGDLIAAADLYQQIITTDPENSDAHHLLGVIAQQQGESEQALRHYQRACQLRPDIPRYHYNLACLYQALTRYHDAISSYQATLAQDQNFWQALENMGVAYARVGDLVEAKTAMAAAARKAPQQPSIHANLAEICYVKNELGAAYDAMREAIRLAPEQSDYRTDLAQILLLLGRTDEAYAEVIEALRIEPQSPAALQLFNELQGGVTLQ